MPEPKRAVTKSMEKAMGGRQKDGKEDRETSLKMPEPKRAVTKSMEKAMGGRKKGQVENLESSLADATTLFWPKRPVRGEDTDEFVSGTIEPAPKTEIPKIEVPKHDDPKLYWARNMESKIPLGSGLRRSKSKNRSPLANPLLLSATPAGERKATNSGRSADL